MAKSTATAAREGRRSAPPVGRVGARLLNPTALPEIGRRLIATREALGLSQAQICRRAGIATNTYNQWEKARLRPSLDQAIRLVRTFGLTLDWVYLGDLARVPHELAVAIEENLAAPRTADRRVYQAH